MPVHVPVLVREVLQYLDLQPGLTVVDGTVGAGGHSAQILERIRPSGRLIGLDRDSYMLQLAARRVTGDDCRLVQASYADLAEVLAAEAVPSVDRVLLDLGLSSDQLADRERGFSVQASGDLDLRFDRRSGEPAWQLVNTLTAEELAQIFSEYGEERLSRRIAERIVERRRASPLRTAAELAALVADIVRPPPGSPHRELAATRVFQALRIAVNAELDQLDRCLTDVLPQVLKPGGKVVIISFHSLEDRRVKQAFRDATLWHNLTPKPISATTAEQRLNPRCRTAKLRAAQRL